MDNGIQFLSLGGGVDSSALLAMHICRDESAEILGITREELDAKLPNWEWVVFADPGSEWKATYENIEYAKTKDPLMKAYRKNETPFYNLIKELEMIL